MEAALQIGRPLVIIADEIEPPVLAQMVVNNARGILRCLAVKTPSYGEVRMSILGDLAALTGAKYFCESLGDTITTFTPNDLGTMEKVISSAHDTIFVGPGGDPETIKQREDMIRAEIEAAENDWYTAIHKQRLAALNGTICRIYIGGKTESEIKERKDRVDDSLQATQAAVKAGILPGAGTALNSVTNTLLCLSGNPTIWPIHDAFMSALKQPFNTILTNGAYDPEEVQLRIQENSKAKPESALEQGFNSLKGEYVNLYEAGIIDPALVVTSALEAASSVACTLILTDATVTLQETPESRYPMGTPPPGYRPPR